MSDDEREYAERAVLGAMLLSQQAIEDVSEILSSVDFHRPPHGTIFVRVIELWSIGEPADAITVAKALADSGDLARIGGAPYLHTLVSSVPTAANATYYARRVADHARLRRLATVAAELSRAAEVTEPGQMTERLGVAIADLELLANGRRAGEHNSWAPIDLGPYLRGEVERPQPSVGVARSDGLRLLYPGHEHTVIGEMEAGKSWVALACAAAEVVNGNPVVYIHFEETDPGDSVERLVALGVREHDILKLFRFVGPAAPVTAGDLRRLLDPRPTLVILDGVNEGMSLHGQAIREEDGAAQFRQRLVKPCMAVGAATLALDHVVKDPDKRGRNALGSIHKGNAVNGVIVMLENAEPFGRGQRGRSHVFVTKDRPGHLRRNGRASKVSGKTFMGSLVVDDTRERLPYLDLAFLAPAEGQEREQVGAADEARCQLVDAVHEVISEMPEQMAPSERQLFAAMRAAGHSARNTVIKEAMDDLIVSGRIERFPYGRGIAYRTSSSGEVSA